MKSSATVKHVLLTLLILGGLASAAQARVVSSPVTHKHFGIVPTTAAAGRGASQSAQPRARARASLCATDCSPLLYGTGGQTGPVQHGERDYLFFWDPGGALPPAYKAGLQQWLSDLVSAGAANATPIAITEQYYDNSGPGGANNNVQFAVQNGGAIVDTAPYPAGCSLSGFTVCITDAQIETELARYIAAHGLPTGTDVEYFVLTPQGVASCLDSNPADGCSYTDYCGYHSNFQLGPGGQQIIYADLPWTYGFAGCDNGPPYPNANQIDSVVDTFSHELAESMTDPVAGTGWIDSSGNEIADKCVNLYGNTLTAANGAAYNVSLGSDRYLTQTEFSNQTGNCEATLPVPLNTAPPTVTGQTRQGSSLAESAGLWSNTPTGFAYQWMDCDGAGANCVALPGATGQSYRLGAGDVGHTVRVAEIAINSFGHSAPAFSSPTHVVTPLAPVSIHAPAISGQSVAGGTLTEAATQWANNPTTVWRQWVRCDRSGGNCSAIPGATARSYALSSADIGHTIRLVEAAANAGGQAGPVSSAPTRLIAPSPAQVRATLRALAGPGARARLTGLIAHGRTAFTLHPPSAGRLIVTARVGRVTVGRSVLSFSRSVRGMAKLTLTPQGRSLLRGQRHPAVALILSFTPAGGRATTVQKSFQL